MKTWYVYLLRCQDNSLYCGVTTDPERRLAEHNSSKKGAKYTRSRRPVKIEAVESLPDKRSAYKLEYAVKQKPSTQKAAFLRKTALKMRNEFKQEEKPSINT